MGSVGQEIEKNSNQVELYATRTADANAHFDAVDFNLPMQLSLFQYPATQNRRTYFNWKPSAPQWWITGFNYRYNNPLPSFLLSVGKIDFRLTPKWEKILRKLYWRQAKLMMQSIQMDIFGFCGGDINEKIFVIHIFNLYDGNNVFVFEK